MVWCRHRCPNGQHFLSGKPDVVVSLLAARVLAGSGKDSSHMLSWKRSVRESGGGLAAMPGCAAEALQTWLRSLRGPHDRRVFLHVRLIILTVLQPQSAKPKTKSLSYEGAISSLRSVICYIHATFARCARASARRALAAIVCLESYRA